MCECLCMCMKSLFNSLNFFKTCGVPVFRFAKLSLRHVGWNVFACVNACIYKDLFTAENHCFHPQSVCSFHILEGWIEHKLSGFPFAKASSKLCGRKNGCWQWAVASELPVVSPVCAAQQLPVVSPVCTAQQLRICILTKCSEWDMWAIDRTL